MTIIEIMVATGIGTMVLAVVASLMTYTARSLASVANYVDMDQKSRITLDTLTSQIRKMDLLTSISSNSISFRHGTTNVSFTFNPTARTLSQTVGGTTSVLLSDCDSLTFSIYQRNTVSNTFDQFPISTSSNTCKLVQMNWACSRSILGKKVNTETEQTAKVVIRRQ